jgi:ankyrin repeat protein
MDDLAPEQEFASAAPQVIQVATPALAPRSPRRQEQSQPRLEKSSLIHRQDSQCVRAQQELAALNIAVTEASLLDAIEHGHISVVRLLLAAGVSPNARDHEGWTPLMLAARDNQQDLVQTLLDLDAHVNARNKTGGTALMMAAMNDHLLIVDTLIRHGAVIDAQTPQGWTALTYASWKGHREVVAMLL